MNELIDRMILYYSGDPKRVQHFMKVYAFARIIAEEERLEESKRRVIEIAAVVHDIGIKNAEAKYGYNNGRLQEQEGPPEAKKLLEELGLDKVVIERVCYLVAHHHTYSSIDGLDYRILVEADFLVNLYEENADKTAVKNAYDSIFKTKTGRRLCAEMYNIK